MYASGRLVRPQTSELVGKLRDADGWPGGRGGVRGVAGNIMGLIRFIVMLSKIRSTLPAMWKLKNAPPTRNGHGEG